MTWQGKRRKQLPSNWGAIRKAVLVRDGYRCTVYAEGRQFYAPNSSYSEPAMIRCGSRASEVHHINGPTDHRLESLRSICAYHHNEETQREAKAAQAKRARKREPAPHPGLR